MLSNESLKKSEETGKKKKTKEEADALKRREMHQASVVVGNTVFQQLSVIHRQSGLLLHHNVDA